MKIRIPLCYRIGKTIIELAGEHHTNYKSINLAKKASRKVTKNYGLGSIRRG